MKELAGKIQICINTLAVLNMPSTFDNVNHMTGIYRLLSKARPAGDGRDGGERG